MKTITITSVLLMLLTSSQVHSQEKKEPRGKAIVEIYTNFHSGFGAARNDSGFELERSYIGYQYHWGHSITVKGVIDVGVSDVVDGYQNIAYIKNALISWNAGAFTLNGGLITNTQFNYQENFWGYRYIYKSFQDYYKFGSSADLGISATYKFAKWLSSDIIIANGEGYKKIQTGNGLLYGIGVTITPVKGLSMRFYASLNEAPDKGKEIVNYAMFAGYKHRYFSVGTEYNIMRNHNHTRGHNLYGFSLYASGAPTRWFEIYARTDGLMSNGSWNELNDEVAILAGVQFKLGEYVKIAPNFRMSIPKSKEKESLYYAYISCSFGL